MKKIKKYAGLLVFLLTGCAVGVVIVIELESMHLLDLPFGQYMLVWLAMLCFLFLVGFLQIIVHEAGHLVFGLMTGYGFSSFRIGSLMWIRQDGKLRLRRFSMAGTAGQCLLLPPPLVDGKMPYVLYNLGGCFANLVTVAVCLPPLLLCGRGLLHMFLLLVCVMGGTSAISNGIPMNAGGVSNDGYNALSLGKNPAALRAFWHQMKVNEAQASGVRVKDMPEEWFELPPREEMGNTMCSAMAVLRTNLYMDRHEFELAAQSIDALLEESKAKTVEIQGIYLHMMACDRIFCELIGGGDREVVARLLTKEVQMVLKQMKNMISVIRTQYVLALLYHNKPEEALKWEALFEKQAKQYPHPAEVQCEREFMQLAKEAGARS